MKKQFNTSRPDSYNGSVPGGRCLRSFVKLSCAALSMALMARADSLAALAGMSAWKFVQMERQPGILWRHIKPEDFQDTRFEYRWKSERSVDRFVCVVEVRPRDDSDQSFTIPEINVQYTGPNRIGLHFHVFTTHDVAIGKQAHAVIRQTDCDAVDIVSWRK